MGSCIYALRTQEGSPVTIGIHFGNSLQLWSRFADLPDPQYREFRVCPVEAAETRAFFRFMHTNLKRLHLEDDHFRKEAWPLFGILAKMCVAEEKKPFIMHDRNKKFCEQLESSEPVVKKEPNLDAIVKKEPHAVVKNKPELYAIFKREPPVASH